MPHPSTAIVRPFPATAPRCAAASMPRAKPLTMVTPRSERSLAISSVSTLPEAVALRPPHNRNGYVVLWSKHSAHIQQRRWIRNGPKPRGIGWIKDRECSDVETFNDLHLMINLPTDIRIRSSPNGLSQLQAAAGADQLIRGCRESSLGRTKCLDQLEKRAVSDTVDGLEREPRSQ